MKTYSGLITKLEPNQVFVFGSNTQGRHGLGAAKWAYDNAGAIYGQAQGLQGQSYAIVTKDLTKKKHPSVSRSRILLQLDKLWWYVTGHQELEFLISYPGKGIYLNGYTPEEMADMFSEFNWPKNVIFEENMRLLIQEINGN